MNTSTDWFEWRAYLQENETKTIISLLPNSKMKILEIGGGDGLKSMQLHDLGYDVTCVDVAPWEQQYYHVEKITNDHLPYISKTFDVVLSTNVVPHVVDKKRFFEELERVLKDDGIVIHVVPSAWWSISTNFWHYLFIPKYLVRSILPKNSKSVIVQQNSISEQIKTNKILKIKRLFLHPLGENLSFLHEIFYFTKNSWIKLFKFYNYDISEIKNEKIFFTGYGIFKNKYIKSRKFLGSVFPSQYYFKLKKSQA